MPSQKHVLPQDNDDIFSADLPHLSGKVFKPDGSPSGQPTPPCGSKKKVKTTDAPPRTGQACDRCKGRKIRCDDTLGGCLPCRHSNTECKTTDRITHRATARGHAEQLERELGMLRQRVMDLEDQLKELGVEPRPISQYLPARDTSSNVWQGGGSASMQMQAENGVQGIADPRNEEANMFASQTSQVNARIGLERTASAAVASAGLKQDCAQQLYDADNSANPPFPPHQPHATEYNPHNVSDASRIIGSQVQDSNNIFSNALTANNYPQGGPEYLNSANALMALGGHDGHSHTVEHPT